MYQYKKDQLQLPVQLCLYKNKHKKTTKTRRINENENSYNDTFSDKIEKTNFQQQTGRKLSTANNPYYDQYIILVIVRIVTDSTLRKIVRH